jgi:HEPN domain-containing protein
MDTEEKFDYWYDAASYDLATAEAMQASRRWVYVVSMCQQALEKLCKGIYLFYIDDNIPRLHDITEIIKRFAGKLPKQVSDEYYTLFDRLSQFYLEGRYPEYLSKISNMANETTAKEILRKTKEAFTWLLTLKPSIKP